MRLDAPAAYAPSVEDARHAPPAPAEWWRPERPPDEPAAGLTAESRSSGVPFWSLMAFTAVLLFSPQQYFPALAPLRPALVVIGVGILAHTLDRWSRRTPLVEWTAPMKVTAALLGWAAVTIPFSLWPGGSLTVLVDHYLKTVAIFWLLSEVVRSPERLRQAAWSLTWMAVGLGLFVVYNYATGATFGAVHERVMGNEGALTKNPNDLALMINLITPLTVALFLGERRALKRHLLAAAIGMEMGTVVLTYSRGGAVTLGVIVLLYLWKLRRRPERPWLIGLIVAAVLALPLVPSSYFDRLGTITDVDSDPTGSSQERWSDMVTAAKTILANPVIGAGIGMNTVAMREARGGGWAPVHNVYLEHALDLGLPGLALFGYLLAACIKAAVSAQRWSERRGRADVRLIAEALQVSLLAYATAAMFHPVSYHPYFYYMAGLAVATWRMGAGARAEAAP